MNTMEYNMKNQRGFSLIETMVAGAILATVGYGVYGGIDTINQKLNKSKLKVQASNKVVEIINTFSTSASYLQVDYSPSATFPTPLPVAWDLNGEKMLLKLCNDPCPLKGRMGVIVTPSSNKKLYYLKVRMEHPSWNTPKISTHIIGAE